MSKKVSDICAYFAEKIRCFNSSCYIRKVRNNINNDISEVNTAYELLVKYIDKICEVYNAFLSLSLMGNESVNVNLNRVICEAGMVYEAIGYYRLFSAFPGMIKPCYETDKTCSKKTVNLDGIIGDDVVVDFKRFQPFNELVRDKLSSLTKKFPNYCFFYTHRIDVNKEQFWNSIVETKIKEGINFDLKEFKVSLPNGGKLSVQKREKVNMSESYCSPMIWCENTYKFVLANCNQFTTNKPFVQINMFDKQELCTIENSVYLTLRILTRRTFFELKNNKELASEYCKEMQSSNLKVRDVIKYLSAIAFIDINEGELWFFCNPFAKNKISKNFFEPYGWVIRGGMADDFSFDIY